MGKSILERVADGPLDPVRVPQIITGLRSHLRHLNEQSELTKSWIDTLESFSGLVKRSGTAQKAEDDQLLLFDGLPSDGGLPFFALPKLLPDHSDVDPARGREHLDLQVKQIVSAFKELTDDFNPYLESEFLKRHILQHFRIPHPDYWMARTSRREPERWWKQVYDKAIERMDLHLGLIARSNVTGRKGVYALRSNLKKQLSPLSTDNV